MALNDSLKRIGVQAEIHCSEKGETSMMTRIYDIEEDVMSFAAVLLSCHGLVNRCVTAKTMRLLLSTL